MYTEEELLRALDEVEHEVRHRAGPRISTVHEVDKNKVQYAEHMMKEELLFHVIGYCRVNMKASNEHAAHCFLRCYGDKMYPFKTPFRPIDFVPDVVWENLVEWVSIVKQVIKGTHDELIADYWKVMRYG